MPSLLDALYGIERGVSEGDENMGVYLKAKAEEDEKLAKMLEDFEKKRRQEAERKIKLLKEEERQLKKKEGKLEKNIPFLSKDLRKRKKEISEEIERYAIDEQKRLLGLSESLTTPSIEKKPTMEANPTATPKAKVPEEAHLSDEEYEQGQKLLKWMTGGKASDILKSIPSAWMETGEGLSGLFGDKGLKEKIRGAKKSYEEKMGIDDRDAMNAQTGRLVGDIINPLGIIGRGLKLGKLVSKVPKLAKLLGGGSLYGAIQAEKDDANPLVGAAMGAGTAGTLQGVGKVLSKAKKAKFKKIKDRATFTTPDEISRRASMMGEKATIPELVGDETLINKLKKDSSMINRKRLSGIEGNIKQNAKAQIGALPKGEEELMSLYTNTGELKKKIGEGSSKLYDVVKESGIGNEGLLEKPLLRRVCS